jgi:hypothetical protein
MDIARAAGRVRIMAQDYQLEVRQEPPRAVLADRRGRIWSALSLLADLDCTDARDEMYGSPQPQVAADGDGVVVRVTAASPLWRSKVVTLRCTNDRLELTVTVEGHGTLTDVRLLGGHAVLPDGAAGTFRSGIEFASLFSPNPTEPVQVVRPAGAAATVGVVGDDRPGRWHGVFSPAPLCLALGRERASGPTHVPTGDWLSLSVQAPVAALTFPELAYEPLDGGFWLRLDYDGHTSVDGHFTTPALVLRPVPDPYAALERYRTDLVEHGWAADGPVPQARWWREPAFCGWGAQCARAPLPGNPPSHPRFLDELPPAIWPAGLPGPWDLANQTTYDELLARLADHGVRPGTVVIDDRWQRDYGRAEPDAAHWPDLRAWIADRHAAGMRVLLWWKAWDPAGVPAEECVLDPSGRAMAVDPGNPAYLARLREMAAQLVAPDGLNADGLKVDFTQRAPMGGALRQHTGPDRTWGIAALHQLLQALHSGLNDAKPDALLIAHTVHPSFGDVCDMVRLNDLSEQDPDGTPVSVVEQLHFRTAVARAALPHHLIDTDQWPMPDRESWRAYLAAQNSLGVPALYYVERMDRSDEEINDNDLAAVAEQWATYRGGLSPIPSHLLAR